jgi:hypothetical protein
LYAAKEEWSQRLLLRPARARAAFAVRGATTVPAPEQNVVGVGIGEKLVDGRPTGIQALKFFVRVKYPAAEISAKDMLPKHVNGLPVDVEEVGLLRALPGQSDPNVMPSPRTRFRPAPPGCSVGFQDPSNTSVMAGTLGAVVKKDGTLFILSNNHVLADENRLPIGAPIFQPGLLDGGKPASDQIATLAQTVKLRPAVMNKVDGAIAKALQASLLTRDVLCIGAPQGKVRAKIDMIVHKFGRTTGYSVGRVTSTAADVTVQYDTGNFTFQNQIMIVGLAKPFSDAGDSGSLILERGSQKAIGLLFAGSPTHTIANHIAEVLRALRVTLA